MGIINKLLLPRTPATRHQPTTRKVHFFGAMIMAGLLLVLSTGTFADTESPLTLDFIDFKKMPGNAVEIRMALSGTAPNPTDFTSKSPARISLDLPGVDNNLPWSLPLPIDIGLVKNVKSVQSKGRTRVVVNIDDLVPYELRREGNNIFLTLNQVGSITPDPTPVKAKPVPKKPTQVKKSSGNNAAIQLQDATFTSLPGDSVQIRLAFNGRISEPGSFTIDNPARVVLDFPSTGSSLGWKNKNIGIGFAKSITAVEAGDRTRVILNLVQLIPFESEISGNNVVITLAGSRAAQTPQAQTAIHTTQGATPAAATSGLHRISNIDFRRGEKGEGRIIVSLSDDNTPISTGESGQQIFVEFGDTALPDSLQQRLDVIDFATPVQYIDTTQTGDRVRLAITPTGDYEYLAYHTGNSYTIEVRDIPKEKKQTRKKDIFGYSGDRLSLNFQDIEVRAVLQLIADFTSLNMVTSDSVAGNLTLRLKNVPWDQALDIILKTKGLAMRKAGNVILVAPAEEVAAQEKLELESNKQIEELAPLRTELIQINYAKASEMAKLLNDGDKSMLSSRGSATIDERTNTLIVTDVTERLDTMRKTITTLDIPIRQVMIESRIVIANDDFAKSLGVRFGVSSVKERGGDLIFGSGSLEATDVMSSSAMNNLSSSSTNGPYPILIPTGSTGIPQRMNVNMPVVGNNAGRIALSILGANTLLDLELSALQSEGRGEVVSNPRVITSDQHEATIKQGTEIPYLRAASSGATAVTYREAVVGLSVTPHITPDDRIILDLTVKKDSVGQLFLGIPSIDKKEVQTQVLMNNGETVVLGGVYEQTNRTDSERIPFFGDLPFIGALFRNTREQNEKSELLIFVTPKILKQQLGSN